MHASSSRANQNAQVLVLEPATVERHYVFRPPNNRRTETAENYAEEFRRREFEEFQNNIKPVADSVSSQSGRLEQLEGFSDINCSRSEVPMDCDEVDLENEKEVAELYSRYNFKSQFDPKLSITGYKHQILEMVESKQVSIVQGGTGCGKSTQVCQFILDDYVSRGKHCNIVVTQPRRIAAISVARRVCAENEWQVGSICGYQVGLDKEASSDTRILFCTIGVFLQKLITAKRMNEYTHIILDEVHDRGQDTDFCLFVVRKLMRTMSTRTKVILMSATLELPLYREYLRFKTPTGEIEEPSIVKVVGDTYDVTEMYLDDLNFNEELPERDEEPRLHRCLVKLAVNLILSFTSEERMKSVSKRGSVLVFLPGLEEIEDMKLMLEPYVEEHRLELKRLHSAIPSEEQASVFVQTKDDQRKVILATNIAESSITVADVKYVIDFCLTKSMVFNISSNYSSLKLQWASKSSCAQRKGRAGRVADGIVYRMVEYHFFQSLEDFDIPEMLTSPLDHVVLKSKLLNMGSPKEVLALTISPPDLRSIEKTVLILKEEGALSPLTTDLHDGELTFMGKVLAGLPVDTRIGKLVLLGYSVGLLEETIIIGSLHSVPSIFVHPNHLKLESYQNKLKWSNNSMSDSLACYFAYKAWEHLKSIEKFASLGEEQHWCRQHFIELKRLREVKVLSEELKRRLEKDFHICLPQDYRPLDMQDTKNQFLLKILLCGAFYPNYFLSSPIDEGHALRTMGGHNHLKTVVVKGFPDGGVPFYKRDLRALFRRCDPMGGEVKIHADHTKAYIEFKGRETNKNCTMAVCSALKMNMLRMPMEVNADPSESALEEDEDNYEEVMQESISGKARAKQVSYPPPEMKKVAINVTETVDCGHFWGTYCDKDYTRRTAQMHKNIQDWLKRNRGALLKEIRIGCYCLAPFTDEDNVTEYYRTKIINRTVRMAKVFFLDYGNQSDVEVTELYKLDDAFLSNPFQAMEFQLVSIRPSQLLNFSDRWVTEAKNYFEGIINEKGPFFCEVFSIVDNIIRVQMFPMSSPDDNVAKKLIENGFAEHCEENSISKQNNALRLFGSNQTTQDPRAPFDDGMFNPLFNKPAYGQVQTLEDVVRSKELYKARQVWRLNQLKKVNLSGPTSSYELSFNPLLTTVGSSRVERHSVNSVVISSDPTNPTPHMMVAAFVGISPSRNGLVIRESTVLPKIRGLSSLVTLLFAPMAEYRTNRDVTRFTGAICGLGCYKDSSNEAVLAENDIEVTFDVAFTFEDLKQINDIRVSMNMVMSPDMNLFGPNLLNVQSTIRKRMFDLFSKAREPREVENFPRPLHWNQASKQDMVTTIGEKIDFFVPHCGLTLRAEDVDQQDRRGREPLSSEKKRLIHEYLLKQTNKVDRDEVFHCLVCNESLVGTSRLAIHLCLSSHLRSLD